MNKLALIYLACTLSFIPLFVNATNKEDNDLNFLPPDADFLSNSGKTEKTSQLIAKKAFNITFDNTLQASNWKDNDQLSFKLPAQDNSHWSNLSRLGILGGIDLNHKLRFKTDVMLNAYTRENTDFHYHEDMRLDIKEGYLSYQHSATQFLDIGRINLKSGVATGFNPSDYFKVGTVLDRNTEDVSQLRNGRLGALMLKGQQLWEGGSLTVAIAPKISDNKGRWYSNNKVTGLNLHKSNDRSRFLAKLTHEISDGISPELIYYRESDRHNLGLNISKVLNKQWFVYGELNIGQRRNLIDEAFSSMRTSKQLIAEISQKFSNDKGESYQQQFAVGASFTSSNNITTKLEYHYNEAGLSKNDSRNWFNLSDSTHPTMAGQLLSVRGLAQTRGEPLGQHSLFLYSNWVDAGMDDLDLTGLAIADLNDQSYLMQLEAAYKLNTNSKIALQMTSYQGKKKSIYGSMQQNNTATLKFEYDF